MGSTWRSYHSPLAKVQWYVTLTNNWILQKPHLCALPPISGTAHPWHIGCHGKKDMLTTIQLQESNASAKATWATNISGSLLIPILGLILNKNMKWVLWNLFLFFPKPQNQKPTHHIEQSSSFVLMATNDKNRNIYTYITSNRHRVVEINF